MKTKEENRGKEEELPKKKELLSEEELLEVAAGGKYGRPSLDTDIACYMKCIDDGNSQQTCQRRCNDVYLT